LMVIGSKSGGDLLKLIRNSLHLDSFNVSLSIEICRVSSSTFS
jgi:hypothetical protein